MAPDTSYTGAVDTSGGTLVIGTAEDKIRLEAACDENELTIDEARALIARLQSAINDAEDWTISHA